MLRSMRSVLFVMRRREGQASKVSIKVKGLRGKTHNQKDRDTHERRIDWIIKVLCPMGNLLYMIR